MPDQDDSSQLKEQISKLQDSLDSKDQELYKLKCRIMTLEEREECLTSERDKEHATAHTLALRVIELLDGEKKT